MAHHAPVVDPAALREDIGDLAGKFRIPLLLVGVVGLVAAGLLASLSDDGWAKRFLFGYLWAYWFFLTISLGGLFFTMIQHVTRAGWSVTVRRLAEMLGANLWVFAPLSLPLLAGVLFDGAGVWEWADPVLVESGPTADLLQHKEPYLNKPFFLIRCAIYFAVWSFWGWKLYALSRKQDETGDPGLTQTMHNWSVAGLPLTFLTVTFAAIDFLMSLTPTWYSTIYGVVIIAGCAVSVHATLAVIVLLLRKRGTLTEAVTVEHQQDLGKLLFGFIVFWAYVSFSQFLLIWYADIPEETEYYLVRFSHGWTFVMAMLLTGHFIIPFLGLLSRHVKRRDSTLMFWCVWVLFMHAVDLYLFIMPRLTHDAVHAGIEDVGLPLSLVDLACFVGIGGFACATLLTTAAGVALVPHRDPRLKEALAFHNT
ncbi:quinol:cytochrome C oxidoreductase [Alienimonas chondri]|uniref:Quinol:cytochrome C oxidoreductase n=1 Tax=Alienimonas chondri TaxID=2681879 RepID=A0ABX1V9T3_9PLAN|nr:quinol:cytochrome C oxidoreductase [Alienimonas chondri]NNJ24823.1 hypothetical protein [Alienimonas chondri]